MNVCLYIGTDRDNSLEECGLELFFSTDFEILGKVEHHDLKPGGDDIKVTDENKQEYIGLAQFSFQCAQSLCLGGVVIMSLSKLTPYSNSDAVM